MKLLTLLPSEHLRRLRSACEPSCKVQAAANPPTFIEVAERGEWDILVVDPELATEKNFTTFLGRLRKFSQPLIIYTALSRIPASAIAALSSDSFAGVILYDYDDSPDLLRNSLARVPIEFFGAQLVRRIGSNVDALPPSFRRITLAAYCSARLLRSTAEYAALCGTTRRSLDRWLQRVGLSPGRWIVSTAQFLRAYALIQSPGMPFAAVSRVSGYGSVRALRHNALLLTGNELRYLRTHFASIDIVDLMERALRI